MGKLLNTNYKGTLDVGFYDLPNGCKAFVRDGKVYVSPKWQARDETKRCKSCKHYKTGRIYPGTPKYGMVCLKKPKFKNPNCYYVACWLDKACALYEAEGGEE